MGFDSPAILVGLWASAIPIAIHLYVRARAREVPLDAVMWLVLSGRSATAHLRLVHALLLACRVLIVAFTVLLFARPFASLPPEPGMAWDAPTAFAIVLDNSLSMGLWSKGVTAWSRARDFAIRATGELHAEAEVFVLFAGRPVEAFPGPGVVWDGTTASRQISRLGPSFRTTDLTGAVRHAAALVRGSPLRDKRIVIASDFFDHGVSGFPGMEELAGIAVEAFDAGAEGARNRAIVDAAASPAPDISPDHVRVRVAVVNDQDEPFDDVVNVKLGRNATAKKVQCPPRSTCDQEFLVMVDEGVEFGEARIPADDLAADDVRWFTLSPKERNAVLLVDGAPSRRSSLDESFFLARALAAKAADDPGFAVTVVRPEELSPLHLAGVATAALLNVARLKPEQVRSLADFAAAGGGLVISAGDNLDMEAWRDLFGTILPAPPRDTIDLSLNRGRPPPSVGWVASDHPAVAGLLTGAGSLSTVAVSRYVVLEPGWAAGCSTLARLTNGAPLVIERRIGRGAVVTVLTTLDRDWTDLPLRPVFAPFVRNLFTWLRALGGTEVASSLRVGEPRRVDLPEGIDRVVIRPPAGDPRTVTAAEDFTGTGVPGVYYLDRYRSGQRVRTEPFVVNTDPSESLLRRAQGVPDALASGAGQTGTGGGRPFERKAGLWPYLLVAVLGLFLAEAYLRGKA